MAGDHVVCCDQDQRITVNGTVPEGRLVERAFAAFCPPTRARTLPAPAAFADVPAPR